MNFKELYPSLESCQKLRSIRKKRSFCGWINQSTISEPNWVLFMDRMNGDQVPDFGGLIAAPSVPEMQAELIYLSKKYFGNNPADWSPQFRHSSYGSKEGYYAGNSAISISENMA